MWRMILNILYEMKNVVRNLTFQTSKSPVCSPSSGGYQCRCEDQYRWSCDQCFLYGSCDSVTEDTCGCINAIPPDGQYCQPADQHSELVIIVSHLKTAMKI